jgi:hypothetical protein
MTQNKMVRPDTGRYQEDRKELARNQEGNIVERKKRLDTHTKLK